MGHAGALGPTAAFTRLAATSSKSSIVAITVSLMTRPWASTLHIGRVRAINGLYRRRWYSPTTTATFTPWSLSYLIAWQASSIPVFSAQLGPHFHEDDFSIITFSVNFGNGCTGQF